MSAPRAAALASITYRQLDYWARAGWIRPYRVETPSSGTRAVRRYSDAEVVRLAALRHVGCAGLDVARVGPLIGGLDIPAGAVVIVGPGDEVEVIPAGEVLAAVSQPGRWVVFDPAATYQRLAGEPLPADSEPDVEAASATSDRRSA
jgi:DNA-binding transcriptional MerR regulator